MHNVFLKDEKVEKIWFDKHFNLSQLTELKKQFNFSLGIKI